jgi:anti-sigma regulatory factor (Ser/Thr protein kinase)/CheY-like chemotaxis protein
MAGLKSILVFDSDPLVHDLVRRVAKAKAWHIESAFDIPAGWQCLESTPFDLVITSRSDLLSQIQEQCPNQKISVITGTAAPDSARRALRAHAYSFISKPFSEEMICEMIEQALESRSWAGDIEVISALPSWISLQVRCKMETAERVLHFIREMEIDLPAPEREQLAMALRELLMNAIEHGGRSDPNQILSISCVRTDQAIIYHIRDPGSGFSMDQLPHAAISNHPETPANHLEEREKLGLRPGGFGILLVRQLADELLYNEVGNEVLLIKYRKNGQPG